MSRPGDADPLLDLLAVRQQLSVRDPLVRLAVRRRAQDAREYCLAPTQGLFQIDHVIPRRHWADYEAGRLPSRPPAPYRRGPDHLDNYAWSCPFCNGSKGGRTSLRTRGIVSRLYDPRMDVWPDHFVFLHTYIFIRGVSPIGLATEQALGFNDARPDGPLGTRHDAILLGVYPPDWARDWAHAARE